MADDPYRGETARLRRRVEDLEQELAAARATIASLRGETPGDRGAATVLLGGPVEIALDATCEGELPAAAHEDLHDLVRARLGAGVQVSSIGKTFTAAVHLQNARSLEITVRAREGRTTIRIHERLGGLAGGLFGGVVGGVGGGGLGGVVPLLVFLGTPPALIALASLLWVLLVYALVRAGYGSATRRRRRDHERLVEDLRAICAEHARAGDRVRVTGPARAVDVEEEAALAEHLAVEESAALRR